jgi:hypothetical protein
MHQNKEGMSRLCSDGNLPVENPDEVYLHPLIQDQIDIVFFIQDTRVQTLGMNVRICSDCA